LPHRCSLSPLTIHLLTALIVVLATACGGEGERGLDGGRALAWAEPPPPPYSVVDVSRSGAIVGRVMVSGEAHSEPTLRVEASEDAACGGERNIPLVVRRGDRLAEVVVWLADARSGKRLPAERRFEVTNERCELLPRVQAAIAGGMLHVKNADAAAHHTRFTHRGLELARARQTDPGQVVPTGKVLALPGLVEARCELHPWTRAWIHVFDHPYFAVTNRDGTFTLDSVPPGTYHLRLWHPALGERTRSVSVEEGEDTKVEIGF
jgi:hypothetical protein